jgi:hypothetical protein
MLPLLSVLALWFFVFTFIALCHYDLKLTRRLLKVRCDDVLDMTEGAIWRTWPLRKQAAYLRYARERMDEFQNSEERRLAFSMLGSLRLSLRARFSGPWPSCLLKPDWPAPNPPFIYIDDPEGPIEDDIKKLLASVPF